MHDDGRTVIAAVFGQGQPSHSLAAQLAEEA